MVFELVTGDFLFQPNARGQYSKDEDHLAQVGASGTAGCLVGRLGGWCGGEEARVRGQGTRVLRFRLPGEPLARALHPPIARGPPALAPLCNLPRPAARRR